MILHDKRGTSYDSASLFRGKRYTLKRLDGEIAQCIGIRQATQHSIFSV